MKRGFYKRNLVAPAMDMQPVQAVRLRVLLNDGSAALGDEGVVDLWISDEGKLVVRCDGQLRVLPVTANEIQIYPVAFEDEIGGDRG